MKIILLNHVNFTTKYCDFWNKLEKYTKLKSLTNVCEDVVNNNIVYHHYYCVDRTETRPYNGMFQFDTTNYIMPKLYYDNITLEQCIADRCAEIVNKNKKIILMYSGGVDSICFLVGFIKNYGYDFCREKMIVCANEQSIEGHSLFYEKFIRDKFELLSSTDSNITLADKTYRDTVIVNGDPANLFDGAVLLEKIMRMNIGLDDKNWKQEIKNNYAHLFGLYHPNAYEHLMDVIESSANSRNYSVDNMFDFIWWYNNNLLYMAHSLNMLRYNYHMLNNNKLANDLTFRLDVSLRDVFNSNSRLDQTNAYGTGGQRELTLQPSIDYVLNSKINLKFYFDQRKATPYISSSPPMTNTRAGVNIRIAL